MPRIISFSAVGLLVLLLCLPATAQDLQVTLDTVHGTGNDTCIVASPSFYIRFTNNSTSKYNISNGFRLYSPDGATWDRTDADTIADDLSVPLSGNNFGFGSIISKFSTDGEGEDTIGFFAQGLPSNVLLPAGFDGQIGSITADISAWGSLDGLHLCIDTVSFFPPGGAWKWVNQLDQQYPTWNTEGPYHTAENDGGPICFRISGCIGTLLAMQGPLYIGPCQTANVRVIQQYPSYMERWLNTTVSGSTAPITIVHSDHYSLEFEWTPYLEDAGKTVQFNAGGRDNLGCLWLGWSTMTVMNDAPCTGRTGNVDYAGTDPNEVDSSDLGVLVNFLLGEPGTVPLCSQGEADVDAQGGENPIDSSDLGLLVSFLFSPPGTVTLPDCP